MVEVQTYEDAVTIGVDLQERGSAVSFAMGDLMNEVIRINNADETEENKSLRTFCREIKIGYSRGKEISRVAACVGEELREEYRALLWSHWRVLTRAKLESDQMIAWCKHAEENNLTAEELAEALKGDSIEEWVRIRRAVKRFAKMAEGVTEDLLRECIEGSPEGLREELEELELFGKKLRGLLDNNSFEVDEPQD